MLSKDIDRSLCCHGVLLLITPSAVISHCVFVLSYMTGVPLLIAPSAGIFHYVFVLYYDSVGNL